MPEVETKIDKEENEGKSQSTVLEYDPETLPDMLPLYYKRLFPHLHFYRWLSYGNYRDIFSRREISFTLHDDIYMRYLSFDSQAELEKEICTRTPHKIDIGAIMNKRPKNFRTAGSSMQPQERELVFDIDMTDYDDVRTCCDGTKVCVKCWKFLAIAVRVLDAALREDFGFEHILWVFSGRRGIHCWVCDTEARLLDSKGRSSVAEYLQITTSVNVNGESTTRVQLGDRIHHSIRRALRTIEPMFEEIILEDQNLFGTPKGINKLLSIISDDAARKDTEAFLLNNNESSAHSRAIWNSFLRYVSANTNNGNANVWSRKLRNIVEEVQLAMLYPRLDINVTKGFNHLLKAPFCIHPATGKVCVPFNVAAVGKFDPTTVPTISQLLQEINVFDDKTKSFQDTSDDKSRIKDYKKTGMFKGVVVFEEFLRKLESSLKSEALQTTEDKLSF